MPRRTLVFGPAYLDRVLRVDRPLVGPEQGDPLDQSVDGTWKFGSGLTLLDPGGSSLEVDLPEGWPGPCGMVELSRPVFPAGPPRQRAVRGLDWHDDLGGMGAGFAAALGGELCSVLGDAADPTSRAVAGRLSALGVVHRPIRLPGLAADWTLLVTSSEYGDKLPIGFRGCHAALESLAPWAEQACDLRVVASLTNRLAAEALRAPGAAVRFFAPSLRNMTDSASPVAAFAASIDVLSCNRIEWLSLSDREAAAAQVAVVAVTDGPRGSTVRFLEPSGAPAELEVPALPRSRPPRDTNRAGEAYAATLLSSLLEAGWTPGPVSRGLVRQAAERASAASALVLDLPEFGFPTQAQIAAAVEAGCVG